MNRLKDMSEIIGAKEVKKIGLYRAVGAEFLGTMFLVFIGCGACLGTTNVVRIALTFGLAVATLAQAIGHVSGCHINPAVTVGMLVSRYVSLIRAVLYIIAQMGGAIAGAAILYGIVPDVYRGSLGNTIVAKGVDSAQAWGIETMITFLLVLVVVSVSDKNKVGIQAVVPLAIGLSITTCHLFAVPLTGSSMNPARSFGPAVIMGGDYWDNHWVYWVGPLSGGVLAGLIYMLLGEMKSSDVSAEDMEIPKHGRY